MSMPALLMSTSTSSLLLLAVRPQFVGGLHAAQVHINRVGAHIIRAREFVGHGLELLLLVTNQEEVGMIVACQLGGILQSDTTAGACYERAY